MVWVPPYRIAVLTSVPVANLRDSSLIWMASSLVGVMITAWGACAESPEPEGALVVMMRSMIGRRKAAVLPLPVWALAIRSLPAMMIGIPCFWTGVGTVYSALKTFSSRTVDSPDDWKLLIGGGLFSPRTFTGMESYLEKLIPVLTDTGMLSKWKLSKVGSWASGKLSKMEVEQGGKLSKVGSWASWKLSKVGSWASGKLSKWEFEQVGIWASGKLSKWKIDKHFLLQQKKKFLWNNFINIWGRWVVRFHTYNIFF